MITGIDHINIVVSDLEKSAKFFEQLGFQATRPAELHGDWISAIVGLNDVRARYVVVTHPASSTNIELICYESPPPPPADAERGTANAIGFRHIAFPVDDIETETARLKNLGIEFRSPVHEYPATGKKLVYFHGPDGILLELAEYPKRGK